MRGFQSSGCRSVSSKASPSQRWKASAEGITNSPRWIPHPSLKTSEADVQSSPEATTSSSQPPRVSSSSSTFRRWFETTFERSPW